MQTNDYKQPSEHVHVRILIVDIEHNDEKSIKHIWDGAAADVDRYFINSL